MADFCVPITLERIRARIVIGDNYFVTTGTDLNAAGDIMSFSVNASRGQSISTFRCQLSTKISSGVMEDIDYTKNNLGQQIIVYAGVGEQSDTNLPRIFTGYVTSLTQDPHWDDARKFILNISGEDVFALMKSNKYSRRFKTKDDAFAVITGGRHREGGRMTQLKRVPAGKAGVDWIASGSNESLEHSPLIKTPDPQGTSPSASSPPSSKKTEEESTKVTASPSQVSATIGSTVFIKLEKETKDGMVTIDPSSDQYTVGTKCLCHMNPAPSSFKTGEKSRTTGLNVGEDTYPLKLAGYESSVDPTQKGLEILVTGQYPAKITYVDPTTGATVTINFMGVPPHSHRTLPEGGPAVATWDTFQV
jgi:hypothetical protein